MPIYEYACQDCGSNFEKLVRRAAESADVTCPSCGTSKISQQYSTFAAQTTGETCAVPAGGGCGAGMCGMPGVCGRN